MEDFTNVRLSAYASQVAEKLKERGLFDYEYDAAKFAMGYVIKNYYGCFDPATYQVEDNNGSNHSKAARYDVFELVEDSQVVRYSRIVSEGTGRNTGGENIL